MIHTDDALRDLVARGLRHVVGVRDDVNITLRGGNDVGTKGSQRRVCFIPVTHQQPYGVPRLNQRRHNVASDETRTTGH